MRGGGRLAGAKGRLLPAESFNELVSAGSGYYCWGAVASLLLQYSIV